MVKEWLGTVLSVNHPLYRLVSVLPSYPLEIQSQLKIALQTLFEGNLERIRSFCFEGIKNDPEGLRAIYWKILLGYIPAHQMNSWFYILQKRRNSYFSAVKTFIFPQFNDININQDIQHNVLDFTPRLFSDQPKNIQASVWELLKEVQTMESFPDESILDDLFCNNGNDIDLLYQIHKDVFRTQCPDQLLNISLKSGLPDSESGNINLFSPKRYSDLFARILFIYAKLNARIRYVQGMNELLCVLFYTIFKDKDYLQYSCEIEDPLEQVDYIILFNNTKEADVFFCFILFLKLNKHGDCFCGSFDYESSGILVRVERFYWLLQLHDLQVFQHFDTLRISPLFFALRWLLVLFVQEFSFLDVLRLWDSFIAEGDAYQYNHLQLFYFVALAIISELRWKLLNSDFSSALQLLQHVPFVPPDVLLSSALGIRVSLQRQLSEHLACITQ